MGLKTKKELSLDVSSPPREQPVDLYPICSAPKSGELFSSWMTTVALDHGINLNSLIVDLLGNFYFHKRDIDKYAQAFVVEKLAIRTNVAMSDAVKTSLFLRALPISSIDKDIYKAEWVTHVNNIYSTVKNYGLSFCPLCFSEDRIPYFRVDWRLTFVTLCNKHKCLLIDRCPSCKAEISLFRIPANATGLTNCWKCRYDLRDTSPIKSECFTEYLNIQAHLTGLLDNTQTASQNDLTHIREYFKALYKYAYFIHEEYYERFSDRMKSHGNLERHRYVDCYSTINRLIILELAFACFHDDFACNFKEHLKLKAAGKIRNFHRRKKLPCGNWCREHDYLNISATCKNVIERILDTKIKTPI